MNRITPIPQTVVPTPFYSSGNTESQSALFNANSVIWFIAIVLSLAAHAALLFHKNNQPAAAPAMITQETTTHVRFASVSPPPVTFIEPEVKTPEPEPVVIKQPAPIPEPVSKPEAVKKKPVSKPKKVKPIKKKVIIKKPPVKKQSKPIKPQPVSLNTNPQINKVVQTSPVISKADLRLIQQTRKSYYGLLMRHIEVHKHYPRIARKRRIEDKILVSFTLLANGSIENLQINGKRSILEKATMNAINDALPMPSPPKELSLPLKIKFHMNYFLN
jgi:protein TonB